jgi:glycosyltransferase involved in cell wall biosynthesis
VRISIVTPSYNQAQFIRRTIDSVLDQRGDFELDYKVIDGGSTDGTVEILKSYGDRLSWISERDRGQVDAINRGLRSANGDVVSWLNSDDVLMPGALDRVVRSFDSNPDAEWLHGRCMIIDEEDREVRKWISAYKHYRSQRHTLESFLTENYISQMTVFWRRRLHDEIGYLDPDIRYAFDYDLILRLAQRSTPIYIEDPVACFRWYVTSKSGTGFIVQMTETVEIASHSRAASNWTRVQALAKRSAIIAIYRALGVARTTLNRF